MSTSLQHLQNLFNFSDTDLNANRRGNLSKEQLIMLRQKAQHDIKVVLIIPFMIIVGMLSLINFWLALPAIVVLSLIMFGLYGFHQLQLDTLADQKVVKLKGQVTRIPRPNTITHFAVQVENEVFVVDRDIYYQVPEGEYTLYVLENNRLIMGIEPATKKKTTRKTAQSSSSKSSAKKTTSRAKSSTATKSVKKSASMPPSKRVYKKSS